MAKRISTEAYQALRDALAVVTWYKKPFESFVRTSLRDHPQLLAGLNFNEPKRIVADALVRQMVADESRYQEAALQLMLELAAMTQFPDIERLAEPDRSERLGETRAAIRRLAELTKQFAEMQEERERLRSEREADLAQAKALRQFEDDIAGLRDQFIAMQGATDPRQRGLGFESLLAELFKLFDMEPRLAYRTDTEQIDGSLSFDTDDYILEAKWLAGPVDRATADTFATKVGFKGKNALGLLVAVNGFSKPALDRYAEKTPFITLDGDDVFLVLDGRVRLDELLKAKRRHANETGSCYLSARAMLASS